MRTIKIRNNTDQTQEWLRTFSANEEYTLPAENPGLIAKYATFCALLTAISTGDASVGNADGYFSTISDQLSWLRGDKTDVEVLTLPQQNPFSAKQLLVDGVIKKIFTRLTGIQANVQIGDNTIIYTIPYTWMKISGMAIINGETLDIANFYVLDTTTGTYFGTPDAVLNQFGINVNISKDFQKHKSNYDADIYQGMQLKVVYNSKSAKTIGINFDLHEIR